MKTRIQVLVAALLGTALGFFVGVHTASHAHTNNASERLALAQIKAAVQDYRYRLEYDRARHPDRYIEVPDDPHHTK